ncbi:MAG: 2-amino-4-hydroxy-6-hydroxymethyldihydropteridine diphosphokinase, partial [Muribaculaceae bacterium]|nr:2-amino-4-hydroxy-6-hydroxymethyldihydropteridine diphosphokinase [Muribaculaceae bacterium]
MNSALICLGSNCKDKSAAIREAASFLAGLGEILSSSGPYLSDPEYAPADPVYLNEVLDFRCTFCYDDLHARIKAYESRLRSAHKGIGVFIDIDIVYWNGECLRQADACA